MMASATERLNKISDDMGAFMRERFRPTRADIEALYNTVGIDQNTRTICAVALGYEDSSLSEDAALEMATDLLFTRKCAAP